MYKLVLLDIDGTTINSKGQLSQTTKDTIKKVVDKGVKVCLCTGRNKKSAQNIYEELELTTPLVASDGSVVIDMVSNKYLMESLVPPTFIKDSLDIISDVDLYMEVFTHEMKYKYCKKDELEKFCYANDYKDRKEKKDYLLEIGIQYINQPKDFFHVIDGVSGFMFSGENEFLDIIVKHMKKLDCSQVEIREDLWPNCVFIIPKGGRKSAGLKFLCQYFNIKIEETMAIGDELNDVEMLKEAGLGIAMENSGNMLKSIADYTTKSNDENGVAFALNKFILDCQ